MMPMFNGATVARYPKCHDRRKCFAKMNKECMILNESYSNGKCPFCKADRGNDGKMIKDDFKAGKPHSYTKKG